MTASRAIARGTALLPEQEEKVAMRIENKKIIDANSQRSTEQASCDAFILDAALRQSLVTLRSLGCHGLRTVALETVDELLAPAFASRWCQHKVVCPAAIGTMEYLTYIEKILTSTGARVLIPSSDGTVALLREHRERIEQQVHIAMAKEPALAIAVNKERTLTIAKRLGMAVPHSMAVESVSAVESALREIGLPAVVKPVESWVENGSQRSRFASRLVVTVEEARRAVEDLTCLGGTTLFQQFLSGERESLAFLYANGNIHARFAQWAKRTNPPLGGTNVLRASIAIPSDIGEQAERLVREIELEGYSEVEFRRDAAGRPYLMEINPRLTASLELAVRAGIDFPYLLYQWACGEPIDVVQKYQTGIWMRHLGGDVATTLASLRQYGRPGVSTPTKALFDFCTSFFVPMRYDYMDWKDPLPAFTAAIDFPRSLLHQKRKKGTNMHV